jgi:hypothetical protein
MPNFTLSKTWKVCCEDLNLEVTEKGIRFAVFDNDTHLGDFLVKNTGVAWLAPATSRRINKKEFREWDKFKRLMESRGRQRKAVASK